MADRCAQCDYAGDLAEHAPESGHWLCQSCGRSLTDEQHDWYACEVCLTSARTYLAGVHLMWTELPLHLGHLRGAVYDQDRPGAADGRPLPGGDVLVLLAGGGTGRSEDQHTHRATDSPSVAFTLTTMEDDWRHTRGDSASDVSGSSARVVGAAVRYLDTFTRWAAQHHPAFSEYLSDLRDLHTRLERATGRHEKPQKAEAECFTCGGDLIRKVTDHGTEDCWACRHCRDEYDWPRYLLALRGRLQDQMVQTWQLPKNVAAFLGLSEAQVRNWAARLRVSSVCSVEDHSLRVWCVEVEEYAEEKRRQAEQDAQHSQAS